jgi:hypothetical protein
MTHSSPSISPNEAGPAVQPGARVEARSRAGSWSWAAFPLLLWLGTRVAILAFSGYGMSLSPGLYWEHRTQPFLRAYPALDGLCRWDCEHFTRIAALGYREAWWTNFFPLYPLLGRGLHELTGLHLDLAMLVIPNIAALGAYLVIFRIFEMLSDTKSARWGLALFAAYPFAFFQAASYPESLMIFFSALAIFLALRGNHIWAGVALGVGVLARHLTMFAGAALVAAQIRQRGAHPRRLLLHPAILGLLIPWLFLGLYCFYQYQVFGNPLEFAEARNMPWWGEMAWWGIDDLLRTKLSNEHVRAMHAYLPFALLTSVASLALLARRGWIELAAFALVFMGLLWTIGMWGIGRYSASVWPAFLPLGVWIAERPHVQAPTVLILALFQGLFLFLFSHQFAIL